MTKLLIGTGGWSYFHVLGLRPLEAYSRAFSFVEINSTFYEIPCLQLVESWRQRVPQGFEFSVRCHRDVTHRFRLEPFPQVFYIFKLMINICKILKSRFLVLVTPPSLDLDRKKTNSIRECLKNFDTKGVKLVWEIRRRRGEGIPSYLISLMQEYNIIHCVDLSREEPAIDSNIVYTRVFGRGKHNVYQFTDEELVKIDQRLTRKENEMAVVSFHNVKMYKDGARYRIFKQTKRFPPVTKAKGQESLREILLEDAEFPASKQELIRDQGWKVIDLTEDKKVHSRILLEKLPDKRFRNIEEVLMNLCNI